MAFIETGDTAMKTIRTANATGKHEVVTSVDFGHCSSRLYVNVDHSKGDFGDATLICKKHTTEAAAVKWAHKVLTEAK